MQINVSYDQSQSGLLAGFVNAINYVVNYFDTTFTANVTISLHVGYGEIGPNNTPLGSNDLGESLVSNYVSASYSSVRNALLAQAAPGAASLPTNSPLSGTLYMSPAEAQALGVGSAATANYYVGFNSAPGTFSYTPNVTPSSNQYYFVGVVEHELSEDMGRVSLIDGQPSYYSTMDLFRYSSPGVHSASTGSAGSTAYFSVNNGNTSLGSWNNNPNNGDLGDWYPSGPASGGNDAFNDYSNPGVINTVSADDITLMQALGWGSPTPGVSLGTINAGLLTQGGVENNNTIDLVWRASNSQTTVWAIDTSGNVAATSLGAIGTGWTILHSGHYLSGSTTQMLTDYTPNGTMTLWWVNNGTLTGINLGQHWPNISYVDSGTYMSNGVDDMLVKNNVDNHMYVWWINSTNETLTGVDLGAHWANISYVAGGNFLGNGSDDMLVKNNVDNGMYVWWVNTANAKLTGINLGSHWGNISYVASGNFLADGSDDMLVKNNVDNHMYVWWVNTTNDTLQGIDLGAHWSNIQFLTSGHFAGSGDEMLVQNAVDSHVYMWWVNTANDTLTGVDLGAISPQWQVVATADYNADGYTDIIWQNSQTGQVQLWLMGGYSGPINSLTVPPVVSQQISNQIWGVGTAIDFTLPANTFTDPQHENLTYSATLVGGAQLPSWLAFNGVTGTFTGAVPNGTSGLNISVTATDTSGLSASETFLVATPPSAPVGISPMRASGFLSTLGVVTHIPYTDGGYANLGNVVADLQYLGITQVRDSLSDGSYGSAPLSSDIYLATQGIKFTTLVETSTTAGLNYALSLIDQVNNAVPGSITAVEGANEINNFPLTFNGVSGLQGAIDLQKALYADVHSDPNLTGVPVDYFTGYDAGSIGPGPNPYTTAGLADYDTQHPYPTYGQAPAWFVSPSNSLPNEGPVYGPAVYTETGYSTYGGSSGGLVAVNQDVQSKYTLDLLMDAAKDGISKTYLYQLMDAYQPGSPQGDDGFGLFDPNNAPKEAATAIHNLTTILADIGAGSNAFTTTPLNYSVAGLPSTGNNMLMEKSNGAYDIVVWNEPQIWNESTGTEITASTVNVNIQLGNTYSNVEVFDPLVGSTPIQTLTHVSSVQLGITDHPLIVEIEPGVTTQAAGASGAATIVAGATLELTAADSATVIFKASTGMLKLDNPSTFTGEIFNFSGNGSLSGSDQIDLRTINYNSVRDSYGTGVLTMTDGSNSATLDFNGSYTLANFKFANDGNGGTIVYDPPVSNSPAAGPTVTADHSNAAFLFHPNLGETAGTDHAFETGVHLSQAEFASAPLAMVHDAHESGIFDAAHDTISLHNNALTLQHHSGFLI